MAEEAASKTDANRAAGRESLPLETSLRVRSRDWLSRRSRIFDQQIRM